MVCKPWFVVLLLAFLGATLFSSVACADDIPRKTVSEFSDAFNSFIVTLDAYVDALVGSSSLKDFVDVLYAFLAFLVFFFFALEYMDRGFDTRAFLVVVLLISGTKVLLNNYNELTGLVWGGAEGLALSIQTTAVNSSHDGIVLDFFSALFQHISFSSSWWNIADNIGKVFWMIVFTVLAALFAAGVALATTWAVWGYAVAKIVGLLFLPFLMLESTRFMFIGWARFFLGFCVYYVIARINLIIIFLVALTFLGFPIGALPINPPAVMPSYTIDPTADEHIALLVMMMIGILAMFSVGSFASAIVGGSPGAPSPSRILMMRPR